MSKIRSQWCSARFHKLLNEGRGQGILKDYQPFIQIHDIPSLGICSRIKSTTVGRVHHLLSRNELNFFYLLDYDDDVTDIREQYPLLDPGNLSDLTSIVKIAETMGIKYPRDPRSNYPYVMTSDFVVTRKDGTLVYSIKESEAFNNSRTRELQEFERRYWEWRGISWQIVTELEINTTRVRNIQWIYNSRDIESTFPDKELRAEVMKFEMSLYEKTKDSILKIAKETEHNFQLAGGSGLLFFQRLLFEKRLDFPIDQPLDLTAPRLTESNGDLACFSVFQ